ncbi:hypothetical protein BDD12DRAFT_728187 [Trichophaea hybrida]|nr:hypothetical protein BDD12DRAFT_728187 [Trichophaea hybrida]
MQPSLAPSVSDTSSSLPLQTPPPSPPPTDRKYSHHVRAITTWIRGPVPPIDVFFTPIFPALQEWPSETFLRTFKRRRHQLLALVSYLFTWLVLFIVVVHYSRFADTVEGEAPTHLACSSTLWGKNNQCGLNGEGCLPFSNSSFAFRCPAGCITSGQVLNPRAVGDQLVAYRPFVVGGPSNTNAKDYGIYRADSFICPAAIHAGAISARYGGCGILSQVGSNNDYPATTRYGISSIGFDATFPSSYTFLRNFRSTSCRDLRWHLFAVSIPFTTFISIVSPHASIPFYATFTGIFFHVALASDPPYLSDPYALVSRALSRFLPAAFIAHFIWTYILQRIHSRAPKGSRTILYLGGLWVGALTNITLDRLIPINRLTSRDLAQQPGAKAALAIIILLLAILAIGQIHYLRLSGQLPTMLGVYSFLGTGLGLLAAIPGTSLRIHHYILALLLLPGCRVLTRPSLLYQGLLVGLFINGVARWGFAGIVETPGSLIGDGLYYSAVPAFEPAPVVRADNVTVYWPAMDESTVAVVGMQSIAAVGMSVLVNDVERYSGRGNDGGEFMFARKSSERAYVRMAFLVRGGGTLDYTRAGVVEKDGKWVEPAAGWS